MNSHPNLSRRDFLKLLGLSTAALAARPLISTLEQNQQADKPNVLIFVFDAWAAQNLQLYGYPRPTMPNLDRFARRALVYHNHYSTASFTVPGTASILTGLHPWTHRAVQLGGGGVASPHIGHNIFEAFAKTHSTLGYAQNPFADIFLYQFSKSIDTYLAADGFNLESRLISAAPLFKNDKRIAFASFENSLVRAGKGESGSLFLGLISRLGILRRYGDFRKAHLDAYPKGPPIAGGVFLLDEVVNGTMAALKQIQSPTMAYFHFFPPHEPYTPLREYADLFDDGWIPPNKPIHPLSHTRYSLEEILPYRRIYDQFLASWDAEFALLLTYLETSGLLDRSIVVFTSDHGEMFERGEIGHDGLMLSEPMARVPLMISVPGQNERKDIHTFTSSVDLLPTLANLAGIQSPTWAEGRLLPGLGGEENDNHSVYAIDAKTASSFSPFNQFSIALMKQRHRLLYYQYANYSGLEFYNTEEDPGELHDLAPSEPALMKEMKDEILQKVDEFNRPYLK